jgi:hypothetical protein
VLLAASVPPKAWTRRSSSRLAEHGGICVETRFKNKYGVDMRVSAKAMAIAPASLAIFDELDQRSEWLTAKWQPAAPSLLFATVIDRSGH